MKIMAFEYIPHTLLTYASRTGKRLEFDVQKAAVHRRSSITRISEDSATRVSVDAERVVITPAGSSRVLDLRSVVKKALGLLETAFAIVKKEGVAVRGNKHIVTRIKSQTYMFDFDIDVRYDGKNVLVDVDVFYANIFDELNLSDIRITKTSDIQHLALANSGVTLKITGGIVDDGKVSPFRFNLKVEERVDWGKEILDSDDISVVLPTKALIDYDIYIDMVNHKTLLADRRRTSRLTEMLEKLIDVLMDVLLYVD